MHQLIEEQYNMATMPQRIADYCQTKKENAADSKTPKMDV